MSPSEYYTPLDHSCDAWQAQDSIIPNNINVPSDDESYFYIKIMAEFSTYFEDEDGLLMTDESSEHVEEFLEPLKQLMQNKNEASWPSISRMLSSVHVPIDIQPNMVHRISKCALSMAHEAHNVGCRVLPMVVSIHVVEMDEDEDEDGDEAAAASSSSFVSRQEMASSKESVEGLETVRVAEGSRGGCVICQEEVVKGCEVKRMPCGHDYHGDCIVKWLGVSNFCPLCRFHLPT